MSQGRLAMETGTLFTGGPLERMLDIAAAPLRKCKRHFIPQLATQMLSDDFRIQPFRNYNGVRKFKGISRRILLQLQPRCQGQTESELDANYTQEIVHALCIQLPIGDAAARILGSSHDV